MAKTQAQAKKAENDFTKAQADLGKVFDDVTKGWNGVFAAGRLPTMDFDSLVAAQRKNFEALTAANRIAFEGVKAVTQRQAELAREAAFAFGQAAKDMAAVSSPEARLVKQAELAQAGYEQTFANAAEIADMLQKTGERAIGLINERVLAQFDEVKTALAKSAVKH